MPLKGVKSILKLLHVSHVGVNKTYDLASSLYYWPGMLNDIKQLIEGCEACSKARPSQLKNIRSTEPPSSSLGPPLSHVGLDMFEFRGNQHIMCVDQWSGYPLYQKMASTTSASVIKVLTVWFNTLGWPGFVHTDGGPQLRNEFAQFCEQNGIKHELASPFNPRANGLAQSEVKVVKYLLLKCIGEKGDMQRVLYEWRNMPKSHGFLPAQLLFGRSQNMLLPQPAAAFLPIDFNEAAVARDQLFSSQADHYNRDKVNLEQLFPGQPIRVQNENTGLWDLTGTVIDVRPDGLSYLVDIEGRTFIRGRPKLQPVFKARSHEGEEVGVLNNESESSRGVGVASVESETSSVTELSPNTSIQQLRRSSRLQGKCVPGSLSSSVCGLSSDTNVQHVPFSYSVPCPALDLPAEGGRIRRNSMNSRKWQSCTQSTQMKIPSTSQTLASPCSISSGQVSCPEPRPLELLHSFAAQSSSAAFGRPRQAGDGGKTKTVCSRPLAPLAPQLMTPLPALPDPMFGLQPPPRLPAQTGLGPPLAGRVFPHHTVMDPVEFQSSRIPSSRHYYTTGILPDVDIRHADRPSKCGLSQPSHTTQECPTELCPGSQNSGTKTTGTLNAWAAD